MIYKGIEYRWTELLGGVIFIVISVGTLMFLLAPYIGPIMVSAAVGQSPDETVTVQMKPSGEREIFRVSEGGTRRNDPQEDSYTVVDIGEGEMVWRDQPSKEWFVDQQGVYRPSETTNIMVIPAPVVQAPSEPQQSGIATTINGIDQIETKAILPESLVVDQLDAVKKIVDNGTLIAQQRFAVEQYKINSEAGLEYLRIVKSFILWGFILSIPFVWTVYWIGRQALQGWHILHQERLAYKIEELKSSERIVRGD